MTAVAAEADAAEIASLRTAVGERLTRDFGRGHWSSCPGFREVGRVTYRGVPLVYFELLL